MAKKKQFVTAAAAFAVAASAVAPAITADAATQTVRLKTDYVRSANLDAVLDQEYKGSEIHWYKSSIDLNKLGVFQTAKGFVKGKGIKVEKSLRVLNYVKEVQPAKEIVLEQGVPASGLRIQPVLFADGNLYNKPVSVSGFNTDKVGEFEGQFTYANKAFGSVTTKVKYKVVATKVELTEVKSSVNDDVLSVTADVKNLKDGEKVELVIYAGRDVNAPLTPVQAEVKDGKLSVKSGKLPAGNHSFILRSGEVKTEVMNFVVEAPMVKEVKAINGKELLVTFNKAMESGTGAASTEVASNFVVSGMSVSTATLSADKKSVTLVLSASLTNNTAYTVTVDKDIKTADGKVLNSSEDYKTSLFFVDTVKPTVSGVTSKGNGDIEVNFSEKIDKDSDFTIYVNGQLVTETTPTADTTKVVVTKAQLTAAGLEAGKTYSIIVNGAEDLVATPNVMDLYNGSFLYNPIPDASAPSVTGLTVKDEDTLTLQFSEALLALSATEVEVYKGDTKLTLGTISDVSDGAKTKFEVNLPSTVYGTGETTANLKVVVKGYKDSTGNFGTSLTQNVTVVKDTQGPTLVSSKYDATNGEFELTFNETLATDTPAANKFILTDANGVLYTAVPKPNDEKTVVLNVADPDTTGPLTALPAGTYTVQVLKGAVTDTSLATNDNVAATATIVKTGAASGDTTKPTVTLAQASKGVITATFTEPVKAGTVAGSATDASNYKINGAALPAGTVITLNAAQTVATITLPADAVAVSQAYLVNAAGVQDLVGNALASDTQVITLTENTTPKLVAAAFQADGTLKLTLSENVTLQATSAADEDDFIITVSGNELTPASYSIAAGTTAKELVVTPASDFSFAAGTLTIKTAETTSIVDAASNTLKSGSTVVVR